MNAEYLSNTTDPPNEQDRDRILEEVYVLAETEWLRNQPNVTKAITERGLQIHAFVYDKTQNRCVRLVESESNWHEMNEVLSRDCLRREDWPLWKFATCGNASP
jgi:carbonic anhydrase